jgi:hypothetical protein
VRECPRNCVGMNERDVHAFNQRKKSSVSVCSGAPPLGIVDSVPDDIRRQLPDDVVDELLAGAKSTSLSMSSRSDRAHFDHTVEVYKPDSQSPKLFIYEPEAPVDLPDERPAGPGLGGEVDVRGE